MTTATPFIWFDDDLREAVDFYSATFPDVRVEVMQEAGEVLVLSFTIAGQPFVGMQAGPGHPHTDAFSIYVECADQAEVDRYWDAIESGGGTPSACGWITDRFGLSWQIIPTRLQELLTDADAGRRQRAFEEMMRQVKIDVAALERAADAA